MNRRRRVVAVVVLGALPALWISGTVVAWGYAFATRTHSDGALASRLGAFFGTVGVLVGAWWAAKWAWDVLHEDPPVVAGYKAGFVSAADAAAAVNALDLDPEFPIPEVVPRVLQGQAASSGVPGDVVIVDGRLYSVAYRSADGTLHLDPYGPIFDVPVEPAPDPVPEDIYRSMMAPDGRAVIPTRASTDTRALAEDLWGR